MLSQDQIEKKYKRELDKKKNDYNVSQAENIKRSKVFDDKYSEISLSSKEAEESENNLEDENHSSNYEKALKRKLEINKKNKKTKLKKKAKEKVKKESIDKVKKAVARKIWVVIAPYLIYIIPVLLGILLLFFIILYVFSIFDIGRNYNDYSEDEKAYNEEIKEDYDAEIKEDYDSEYWENQEEEDE
ncbi:hypothetical protein K9M42_01285 [Patescibacteria group bacterium]|nr:hypothetical protein [Patescibacteria group bacterium]